MAPTVLPAVPMTHFDSRSEDGLIGAPPAMTVRVQLPSRPKPHALLAAVLLVAWSAAHGQSCTFQSTGSPINFPALDPSVSATLTAFMDIDVRCNPGNVSSTWVFSGVNGSAPLRMKHTTQNAYIPYTVAATTSGNGSNRTWRITGTVLAANYQNALVGSYSDILSATVLP